MALKRTVQKITASSVTIYTCPSGTDAAMQSLVVANPLTIDGTFSVNYYNATTATSEALIPSTFVRVGATYTYPRSLNLKTGDYLTITGTANMTVQLSMYELATVLSGFTNKGTWSSSTAYDTNDVVVYNGTSYSALQGGTNQNPATASAYWSVLAQKGDAGAAGAAGAAATVSVGSTTTGSPGTNASVTNSGTSSAATLNFTIPRGTGEVGGLHYTFSTNTTVGSAASGQIRFNNATIGSVTSIGINQTDLDSNSQATFLGYLDDSTSSVKGILTLQSTLATGTVTTEFAITGAVTVSGGVYTIPVTYVAGTMPSDTEALSVLFSRTGDKGDTGATGAAGAAGTSMALLATNTYSTAGTDSWTKPAGAQLVVVIAIGAGGGGASGGASANTGYGGPGGGGAGATVRGVFPAAILGSPETITVGTKGTGGASVSFTAAGANGGTVGNPGNAGTDSKFGSWLTAKGGSAGTVNTSNAAIGGGGAGCAATDTGVTIPLEFGGTGADGSATDNNPLASAAAATTVFMSSGGGAGGSVGAAATAISGTAGGTAGSVTGGTLGAGSTTNGSATAGGNGSVNSAGTQASGGGGGGNCATSTGNATAAAGGNAGGAGAGGGGGGAARVATTAGNVATSGKGGDGGNGRIIVYTYG